MRTILEAKSDYTQPLWTPKEEKWDMVGQKFQLTIVRGGMEFIGKSIDMGRARKSVEQKIRQAEKIKILSEKTLEDSQDSDLYPVPHKAGIR